MLTHSLTPFEGLDEGVHTMHVGGKRRIVIPPSMGFTDVGQLSTQSSTHSPTHSLMRAYIGIGPLPANSSNRKQLNKIIDNVNEGKGELIYDVELVLLADDENDQGYSLTHSLTRLLTYLFTQVL